MNATEEIAIAKPRNWMESREISIRGIRVRIDPSTETYFQDQYGCRKGPFWDLVERGEWEDETFSLIHENACHLSAFIDIGAWIGPFSIFAASLGYKVTAIDPDPVACSKLLANATAAGLSENIRLIVGAVSAKRELVKLFSSQLGDSETSICEFRERGERLMRARCTFEAASVQLSELIDCSVGQSMLIKVDAEGAEYAMARDLGALLRNIGAHLNIALHPENVIVEKGGIQALTLQRREMAVSLLKELHGGTAYRWNSVCGSGFGMHEELMDLAEHSGESLKSVYVQATVSQ